MDRSTPEAVEDLTPMGFEGTGAVLLAQTDTCRGDADAIGELFEREGASFVGVTDDPTESAAFLLARKQAYPALEARGHALLDDVAVPPLSLGKFLSAVMSIAARNDVLIATFGHAGEAISTRRSCTTKRAKNVRNEHSKR